MHPDAALIVEQLGLAPHPEGGFYREVFRSELTLDGLPHGGLRNASTAIYFLLVGGVFSAWHKVNHSDEIWHHYRGDRVDLHTMTETGAYEVIHLGSNLAEGERPQWVVKAGVWQAAVCEGDRYALCGCTVSPGFDFKDFEMPVKKSLVERFAMYPEHHSLLSKYSRDS